MRPVNECPYKRKYELVDWAVKHKKWSKSSVEKLTKLQLLAIWYKEVEQVDISNIVRVYDNG
jgi:hypothetical protein